MIVRFLGLAADDVLVVRVLGFDRVSAVGVGAGHWLRQDSYIPGNRDDGAGKAMSFLYAAS